MLDKYETIEKPLKVYSIMSLIALIIDCIACLVALIFLGKGEFKGVYLC